MGNVRGFEELHCRQRVRQPVNGVYDLTCHPKFAKDYKLRDQIQGAAGSIMHNIAEGSDAGTDPDFIRLLKVAHRSGSEVQSELYPAQERGYIIESERESINKLADEAERMINGSSAYLRKERTSESRRAELHP